MARMVMVAELDGLVLDVMVEVVEVAEVVEVVVALDVVPHKVVTGL
jgi:hypothetical protein